VRLALRRQRQTPLVAAAVTVLVLLTVALAPPLARAMAPSASSAGPGRAFLVAPGELHVMSFNLRYASDAPPNSWHDRRPVVRTLLRRERPELIGTQEGLYGQLRDIQTDLPDHYDSIGLGREGGSRGEAMQIFYDSRRLEPLEFHHYWLSDTPEVVGSKTWGGCCPRMVTWVRFHDTATDTEFYAVNTHLEAFDPDARRQSADLVLQRMQAEFEPRVPVVMTGDFNEPAEEGRAVYDALVVGGPLADTWAESRSRGERFGTFHGYEQLVEDGERIDWILTTPGIRARLAHINTFEQGGQYPSDHLPVQAVLQLTAG
jgi:endonuclease/exonuclease/phosphatase family metal-dependent hydrolase